ncbi:MAG: hypothetical protein IT371_25375 [Deltaproteobacteria bacterium]|nr:hypothetical protein [Deltaproteobacteria bacterium]
MALWSLDAGANKAVALYTFGGPQGSEATSTVRRALGGRYRVLPGSAFSRAAQQEGTDAGSAAGVAAAARVLGVSAVIRGSISRLGGRWVLRIQVQSGHNGARVGNRAFPLRGTRLDPLTARRVAGAVLDLLAATRPPAGAARVAVARPARRPARPAPVRVRPVPVPPEQPAVQPAPEGDPATTDPGDDGQAAAPEEPPRVAPRPPPRQRRVASGGSDYEGEGGEERDRGAGEDLGFSVGRREGGQKSGRHGPGLRKRPGARGGDRDADPDDRKRGTTRPPWESIVEASVGLVLLNRTFAFNDPVEPAEPADYRTPSVVPAIAIDGAVYPLAPFMRNILANFGFVARFYRVVGLKSKVEGGRGEAGTVVQLFEGGLRFRWNILSRASSPILKVGVDFGQLAFVFQTEENLIPLPNITYTYVKLALLGVEVPAYRTRRFAFGFSGTFDYLLTFSAGDIEKTDSTGYGKSSTGGIDLSLGIYTSISGFFVRGSWFYRRYFFDFDGLCYRQTLGCKHAGGALDVYTGGAVNVGYAY